MVQVSLSSIAKGGESVARLDDGRVVFVRGGIPGEVVEIAVTDNSHATWWRGTVTDVVEPSPDRVASPCPVAGLCGGCDWQHVDLARQRKLKAEVVAEQMWRLGQRHVDVTVEPVPGDVDGLGWRTRMRYLTDGDVVGLRGARSHDLVALPPAGCPLAAPGGPSPDELVELKKAADLDDQAEICVTVADGATVWSPGWGVLRGEEVVTQRALGRGYKVRADGFWQVHPGAADALSRAVLEALQPQPGERVLDLYCGVGLFAGSLTDCGVEVFGLESDRAATSLARRNVPAAWFEAGRVEREPWPSKADLVVLDPPRSGAGRKVVERIAAAHPRAIAYVACDEAALGRDTATLASVGYVLSGLKALDMFPMTSHVECVATFVTEG
ncbi:MAG: TRAM domain-containing protein [Propionibacteriaceae bacterium]|nr:TRAM domain-containing protein [Propionibacteriaceae bacterium]